MKNLYSLKEYIDNIKYAINYFDLKIKGLNITKEALLEELNIAYMSYRRSKDSDTKKGREIVEKLEKYFDMKPVNVENLLNYDDLLNEIIFKYYYRGDRLKQFESQIRCNIEQNNYLKPLFQLMLLLVNLVSSKDIRIVLEEQKELYQELKKYKKNYFISPFSELFIIVETIYSGNSLIPFDKEMIFDENMKGLLYYSYASNAYLSKDYSLCLYYANEAKKYLFLDQNYRRIITINLTYFSCLNYIGEYKKVLIDSRKQLRYLLETEQNYEFIYLTKIHYYTACLGINDYDEIINSIISEKNYDSYDYMFLFLAYNKTSQKLYSELLKEYENHKLKFNSKQLMYIDMVIDFINTDGIDAIEKSELNFAFKETLIKNY